MIENLGSKLYSGTKSDRKSDSLGSSADGTNTGITLVSGIKNYAGFDGSNDYINLGGAVADWKFFHASGAKYSVSMWIKLDTVQYTQVFTTEDNSEANGVVMYINSSTQVGVQTWAGGSHTSVAVTTSEFEAGKWYHLVIARDGDDLLIYKDGTKTTGDYSGSVGGTNDASYVPRISGNHGQTAYRIDGAVQQTLVYTDALNQTEVNTLYNSGTPVTNPSTSANGNSNKLKAWYKFQSNADDSHGSFDGTATGITWVSDAWKLGTGAYSFDGSNDYVQIGSSATDFKFFSDNSSAYSLCFWLKPDQTSSDVMLFNNNASTNTNVGIQLMQLGANIRMRVGGDSSGDVWTMTESSAVTTGEWSHWALTWDKTTARMYKNGVEVETATKISGRSFSTSNPLNTGLRIGADSNSGSSNYDGVMDSVGIWKRVLTATEIETLAGFSGKSTATATSTSRALGGGSPMQTKIGFEVATGHPLVGTNLKAISFTMDKYVASGSVGGDGYCAVYNSSGTQKGSNSTTKGWNDLTHNTPEVVTFTFPSAIAIANGDRIVIEGGTYTANAQVDLYYQNSDVDANSGAVSFSSSGWSGVTTTTDIWYRSYATEGALVSSLSNKSNLKANYTMDSVGVSGSPTWTEDFTQNLASDYDSSEESNNQWQKFNASTDRLEFSHQQNGTWSAMTRDITSSTGMNTTLNTSKWTCRFKINLSEWYGADNRWSEAIVLLTSYSRTDPTTNNKYNSAITGFNGLGLKFFNKNTGAEARAWYNDNGSYNDDSGSAYNTTSDNVEGQYYCELSRDGADINVKLWSGSYNGTVRINKTFTVGTDWANGTGGAIKYFGVWSGEDANGDSSYAVAGHIDELKVYNGTGTTGDCPNNFSSTAPISDLVGVRTNSIFQQTDDTPSYWWYNGTSWVLDGTTQPLDTDFSSSTGWTEVAGSSSTKNLTIDTANNEMDCKFYGSSSNGNGSVVYYDLGSAVGNEWVLRFTINYSTMSGNQGVGFVGLFDETTDSDDSQDGIYVVFMNNDNVVNGNGVNGATPDDSWGTNISATLSTGTNYFVTLARTAEGTATIDIKTDSHSGSSLTNYPANCSNISSSITGLRYIKVLDRKGYSGSNGDVATIKDLGFQNGTTEWLE